MPSSELGKRLPEERLDRVFQALSDRTRRAVLARLALGPEKVTDLAALFTMSLPAVSKHLKVLERAGLLEREVDGRIHRCSLAAETLREVEAWLAHNRSFWEERLEALARHLERDEEKRGRRSPRRPR